MKQKTIKERLDALAEESFGCDLSELTKQQLYKVVCSTIRDILAEKNRNFLKRTKKKNVYYMSMEFLVGTSLKNNIFNLGIQGKGILCLESPCPREELIEITLNNDVLKVDGNFAIAWSGSLDFTVERSGKSLIGSAASGEGLVNVYRGTGKVLLAPVR